MSKQINRRDFIKFLGKGTMAAMGAAVAVGLPEREPQIEIEEIEEVEYEFIVPEETSQDIGPWEEIWPLNFSEARWVLQEHKPT